MPLFFNSLVTEINFHPNVGICFSLIHVHEVQTRFKLVACYSNVNKGLCVFSSQFHQVTCIESDSRRLFCTYLLSKTVEVKNRLKVQTVEFLNIEHQHFDSFLGYWQGQKKQWRKRVNNGERDQYFMYILFY